MLVSEPKRTLYVCLYLCPCLCLCWCLCYVHVCVHVRLSLCLCVYLCLRLCLFLCLPVHINLYMFVHLHTTLTTHMHTHTYPALYATARFPRHHPCLTVFAPLLRYNFFKFSTGFRMIFVYKCAVETRERLAMSFLRVLYLNTGVPNRVLEHVG